MLLDNIKRSTLHRNTWHQSLFGYTIAWCWECSRNSWKKHNVSNIYATNQWQYAAAGQKV